MKRFTEIGLFCLFVTLLLAALPALGFGNLGTGLSLLGAAFLTGLFLIWTGILKETFPSYGLKYQLIGTLVLVILSAILSLAGRHYSLEEQQTDVLEHLKFEISLSSQEDLRSTRVTVRNDSRTAIQYRFICRITQLVANRGLTDIRQSSFRNHERSGVLDSGSDAQVDECLSDMSVPVEILDCIDIQVRVFYSLKSQPSEQREKDHGFIALKRDNQIEWADRSTEQKESDCQRFSKYPPGPPLDRTEVLANAIKVQNDRLLSTVGINTDKKTAALLSTDIMAFGESIKDSKPQEPDLEKEGFNAVTEYQKKFMEWGTVNAKEFHRKFDSRLSHVFNEGRREKLKSDETSCLIISPSYPPSLDMTRRCGIVLGQLAERHPLH